MHPKVLRRVLRYLEQVPHQKSGPMRLRGKHQLKVHPKVLRRVLRYLGQVRWEEHRRIYSIAKADNFELRLVFRRPCGACCATWGRCAGSSVTGCISTAKAHSFELRLVFRRPRGACCATWGRCSFKLSSHALGEAAPTGASCSSTWCEASGSLLLKQEPQKLAQRPWSCCTSLCRKTGLPHAVP